MIPDETVDLSNQDLVRVHTASNEIEALSVQAMLAAEGIESALQSRQIPMYDGIARVFNPAWGYVLVRDGDLGRAEVLVRSFLESLEADGGDDTEEEER
ncbi:MAG: hypothetical protein QUS11_02110 [Candidatus Fermentibacter sp.]|nr:hypothetical protein [Candidatus Fermentibacter sp.]